MTLASYSSIVAMLVCAVIGIKALVTIYKYDGTVSILPIVVLILVELFLGMNIGTYHNSVCPVTSVVRTGDSYKIGMDGGNTVVTNKVARTYNEDYSVVKCDVVTYYGLFRYSVYTLLVPEVDEVLK